jgi:hypothetical protein
MAAQLDLPIDAGSEFFAILTWYDTTPARVALAGYTAALKIRDPLTNAVLLSITNAGSGTTSRIKLTVDSTMNADYGEVAPSSVGVVTIYVNATDAATLSGLAGIYDLIMTPGGVVASNYKLVAGTVPATVLVTS